MRNRSRRLPGAALALTMAAALMGAALAAPAGSQSGNAPQDIPFAAAAPGKTTVGVQVTRQDPNNLAFEVPLYMTVAVLKTENGGAEVLCPTGYSIRNSTVAPDGTNPAIAVTGMVVQGAAGGKWSLSNGAPTGKNTLGLSVDGVRLPDVTAGNTDSHLVNLKAAGSSFYVDGKYTPLTKEGKLLSLEGVLPDDATVATNIAPTPQFRLIYTVSLLDTAGEPIGVVYEGPNKDDTATPAVP